MILKALYDYYNRCEGLSAKGLEQKEIGYLIVIDKDGTFVRIESRMKDKKTAYAFGRRKGKAIIGQLVSSGSSSSSGGNSKLVELAKSKLGCKYVWGATGANTFDCSGLIYVSPSMLEIA